LGGNSIHVAILTHKIEETLKEFVYTVALYDAPTIDKLARYLRLNYPQSVVRLFGRDALGGVSPSRGSAVDQAGIAALRSLIRTLPERAEGSVGLKNPSAVFILSPPRPGSTLLRVMLGGHPALFAPPELQLLNYNTLRERKAALSSERDSFWLQGTIRALMAIRNCEADEAIRIMEGFEQRDMSVKEFYRLMQDWLGDVTLVDKTPTYSLDLQTLKRAEEDFEDARYIHLIRHPSPSIASFEEAKLHVFFPPFFTGRHDFTTSQLAELVWDICHQNIGDFLCAIPTERKHPVRFEEPVRNPKRAMEEVAEFLGLPFHPNMINPYKQDRRAQMTDAIHPMARMLGDIKFHQHGKIRAEAAQRGQGRYPAEALGDVTRELARTLGYELGNRQRAALVGLETRGGALAFFCVHPAGGTVLCYRDLAQQLGPTQPFYAFRALSLDGAASFPTSVQELASFYVRELREFQPHGPYQLGGWSFGGLVAFEMALQLAASGQEVALLALFSSFLPRPGIAHLPFRSRDFVLEILREHRLDVEPAGSGALRQRELLRHAFDQAREAGVVSPALGLHDFRRVMVRHGHVYRAHVRMGHLYAPQARVGRIILFEEEDHSMNRHGPFVDWNTVATQVSRHPVPGNHFTMLREPHVRHLAECLREYLLPDAGNSARDDVPLGTSHGQHLMSSFPGQI
jgi:thioesterase domain-containing protein